MPLILISTAFQHNGMIPLRHTCDGLNVSPQLSWSGVPENTRSLVLIVDDPDAPDPEAPKMTWVHWVLYNIPPETRELPEGITALALPSGTLQGKNDWQKLGYGGPCPPIGTHRYFHQLIALNAVLPDLKSPTKAVLESLIRRYIIDRVELVGRYQRQH